MRVKGMHGKRAFFILIDSGSTHNFMDQRMVEMLGEDRVGFQATMFEAMRSYNLLATRVCICCG
ncbi:hypothetical protein V2J09_011040 [Rumex salicifolius]